MQFLWFHLFIVAYIFCIVNGQESSMRKKETTLEEEAFYGDRVRGQGRRILDPAVASILDSSGTQVWQGWEDMGSLPVFGVTHEANRRALKADKYSGSDYPPYYSIGRKYSKKSTKKSSRKGKGGPTAPSPISRPSIPARPSRPSSPTPTTPSLPSPPRPSAPSPSPPSPTPPIGGGCKTRVNVDFLQFTAIPPALVNDPSNPSVQDLGTRYVYNDGLRDQDTIDELQGSRATGTCTRTQARVGNPNIGLQLGSGHCEFAYTLFDGNREITFTASGDLTDSLGGTLSITGGTKSGKEQFVELAEANFAI
jgi:hypothetical protein